MSEILTPTELAELEQLNAARTQGEWRYQLRHGGSPYWAYLHTGRKEHDALPVEDAAFIVTAANNMDRLLTTIRALRETLPSIDMLYGIATQLALWNMPEISELVRLCADKIERLETTDGADNATGD